MHLIGVGSTVRSNLISKSGNHNQQKYIEDSLYEIDDWFFSQLRKFTVDEATVIIGQILSVLNELPDRDGWTQAVAGVVTKKNPTFFVVEYLKQEKDIPILVDVEELSLIHI